MCGWVHTNSGMELDHSAQPEEKRVPKPNAPQQLGHVATLVGEAGDEFVLRLAGYFDGQCGLADLGPSCEIDPDGVLRVTVDRGSFEALGLLR